MSELLGLLFIVAAVFSLNKIEFTHFIMLCAVSVGFFIAGAIESVANAIKDKNIINTKNDE